MQSKKRKKGKERKESPICFLSLNEKTGIRWLAESQKQVNDRANMPQLWFFLEASLKGKILSLSLSICQAL